MNTEGCYRITARCCRDPLVLTVAWFSVPGHKWNIEIKLKKALGCFIDRTLCRCMALGRTAGLWAAHGAVASDNLAIKNGRLIADAFPAGQNLANIFSTPSRNFTLETQGLQSSLLSFVAYLPKVRPIHPLHGGHIHVTAASRLSHVRVLQAHGERTTYGDPQIIVTAKK